MSLVVLIVDDQQTVLNVLELFIGRRGHRVVTARTGRNAIELMRTREIDAALIDIHMPEMNGFATAEALLAVARERGRSLRIWFMTGAPTPAAEKLAKQMGAIALLAKPFEHAQLLTALEQSGDSADPRSPGADASRPTG